METSRRNFLKTMGIATAAAAVFNPANLFANNPAKRNKRGGSSKLELAWENFTGEMKYTFTISGSSRSSTPIVITRLTWDGYTGYGEAAMPPYLGETQASVHEFLKKVVPVLEKFDNPFQIEDILIAVDAIATNNTAAKAAVDIALHDLVGNIIGQPWWKIWGFNPNNTPLTSYTIGYDASDDVVYEKIEEASWTKVIKVKLGMSEKEDKRMINLIRSKTDTVICIDANQGWKDNYNKILRGTL